MILKGENLCDFCFTPINPGEICPKCGLTHETYRPEAGLLLPGTILVGKYIIGRVLGRGGFGATYLAYSAELSRPVAIKEYYPTGIANRGKGEEKICIVSADKVEVFSKGAKRFYEEAQTMARFTRSRNVITVYEFFHANDTVYYSMEYLEGISLKGYMDKKRSPLNQKEAIKVMRSLAEALADIHEAKTLHRDVSPDNIFICSNGDIKLIDFGAAKQVIGDERMVYSVVLKQGYAPAEQYKETGNQGPWTDIYALGASIYYALSGQTPRDAISRVDDPELPFEDMNIAPEFAQIIRTCLHNEIEMRYQNAYQVLNALEALDCGGLGGVTGDVYNEPPRYIPDDFGLDNENRSKYLDDSPREDSAVGVLDKGVIKRAERVGMIKGLILGAVMLIVVIALSFVIVRLTARAAPPDTENNSAIELIRGENPTGELIDPQGKG